MCPSRTNASRTKTSKSDQKILKTQKRKNVQVGPKRPSRTRISENNIHITEWKQRFSMISTVHTACFYFSALYIVFTRFITVKWRGDLKYALKKTYKSSKSDHKFLKTRKGKNVQVGPKRPSRTKNFEKRWSDLDQG